MATRSSTDSPPAPDLPPPYSWSDPLRSLSLPPQSSQTHPIDEFIDSLAQKVLTNLTIDFEYNKGSFTTLNDRDIAIIYDEVASKIGSCFANIPRTSWDGIIASEAFLKRLAGERHLAASFNIVDGKGIKMTALSDLYFTATKTDKALVLAAWLEKAETPTTPQNSLLSSKPDFSIPRPAMLYLESRPDQKEVQEIFSEMLRSCGLSTHSD
jgi:hypothetical protein